MIYQAAVDHSFHLCADRIKINRRSQYNNIRSLEFLKYFFHIILNGTDMGIHADIIGTAGSNAHFSKQNDLCFVPGLGRALCKPIA